MKKTIWIAAGTFLLGITTATAQGINFDQASWKEVLAKAKVQNKLVFVDIYTSWCGPCKKMAAEVFPVKAVSDKFNSSFVDFSINAEKGEGVQIAGTFNVHAFPTYLFVNGDGQLIYRSVGYKEAGPFLQEAGIALREQSDPNPFIKWEDDYASGNRNKDFLIGYLEKRASLKLPSADIIEETFPLLTQADLANRDLVASILYYDPNIRYMPDGKWYNYVLQHSAELDSLVGMGKNGSLRLLGAGIDGYFRNEIIVNKKEALLPVMIAARSRLQTLLGNDDNGLSAKKLAVDYYSGTHKFEKLIPAVLDYVNNGLLKQDMDAMRREDAEDFQKMRAPYLSGQADSTKVDNWALRNKLAGHRRIMGVSYQLRDAAEAVYHTVTDKKILTQATGWARQAIDNYPHFSNRAVYAALLMKIGKQQEAIAAMQQAAEDPSLNGHQELQHLLAANVEKIKTGSEPDHLWHL